jgi:regulatory protein
MAPDPYLDGLKMLARRELSEAQVRQRLARRGHEDAAIDEAIDRLKQEHAIDDRRVAEAIARSEAGAKHRGRLRITRKVESAGIDGATARRAVDEAFRDVDDDVLLDRAIARRMRTRTSIDDDAEFRRLFRYLVGQGYEADRVMKALGARRRRD